MMNNEPIGTLVRDIPRHYKKQLLNKLGMEVPRGFEEWRMNVALVREYNMGNVDLTQVQAQPVRQEVMY